MMRWNRYCKNTCHVAETLLGDLQMISNFVATYVCESGKLAVLFSKCYVMKFVKFSIL